MVKFGGEVAISFVPVLRYNIGGKADVVLRGAGASHPLGGQKLSFALGLALGCVIGCLAGKKRFLPSYTAI